MKPFITPRIAGLSTVIAGIIAALAISSSSITDLNSAHAVANTNWSMCKSKTKTICGFEKIEEHENGGGKVSLCAKRYVSPAAYIDKTSAVCGASKIGRDVRIEQRSKVSGSVNITGRSSLQNSNASGTAAIDNSKIINSRISGSSEIEFSTISLSDLSGANEIYYSNVDNSTVSGAIGIEDSNIIDSTLSGASHVFNSAITKRIISGNTKINGDR